MNLVSKKIGTTMLTASLILGTGAAINLSQPISTEAASGYGVSANTTKANYSLSTDKNITVSVKNDNSYIAGANLILQQKVSGAWKTLDYNSPNPLKKDQKEYDVWDGSYFKAGQTYRFKVEVDRYDNNGDWVSLIGSFYTDSFSVTK